MMKLGITPYEIGKTYLVPIVHGQIFKRIANWPVLGPWHEDAEFIGFSAHHYHVDARFLSESQYRNFGREYPNGVFTIPIHGPDEYYNTRPVPQFLGLRKRKCHREWPTYPSGKAVWLKSLSRAYADSEIGPALVCPHRGAPLQGLTPDKNNCVTCPLHGLRWSCKTGKLKPLA